MGLIQGIATTVLIEVDDQDNWGPRMDPPGVPRRKLADCDWGSISLAKAYTTFDVYTDSRRCGKLLAKCDSWSANDVCGAAVSDRFRRPS